MNIQNIIKEHSRKIIDFSNEKLTIKDKVIIDNLNNLNILKIDFVNCTFQNIEFTNNKIMQVNFKNCKFQNCIIDSNELKTTEIIDSFTSETVIKNCYINNLNIINSSFVNTKFKINSFITIEFKENIFKFCSFNDNLIKNSKIHSNIFQNNDILKEQFIETIILKNNYYSSEIKITGEKNQLELNNFINSNIKIDCIQSYFNFNYGIANDIEKINSNSLYPNILENNNVIIIKNFIINFSKYNIKIFVLTNSIKEKHEINKLKNNNILINIDIKNFEILKIKMEQIIKKIDLIRIEYFKHQTYKTLENFKFKNIIENLIDIEENIKNKNLILSNKIINQIVNYIIHTSNINIEELLKYNETLVLYLFFKEVIHKIKKIF